MTSACAEDFTAEPADAALRLAAIAYGEGGGDQVSRLLETLAGELAAGGVRVAGLSQRDLARAGRTRCDMEVRDFASGRVVRISEDRGREARGCRLDVAGLEEAAGLVEASVRAGADILLLSKFGKHEAEGRGLVGALAAAVERGIPVLVGVSHRNRAAWAAFAGETTHTLPASAEVVAAWCRWALSFETPLRGSSG